MTRLSSRIASDLVAVSAGGRASSADRRQPIVGDPSKAHVPTGHPLRMWKLEEAADRAGVSEELLRNSECPRAHIGRRLLFDPIETIAWVRLHLSHVVSSEETR